MEKKSKLCCLFCNEKGLVVLHFQNEIIRKILPQLLEGNIDVEKYKKFLQNSNSLSQTTYCISCIANIKRLNALKNKITKYSEEKGSCSLCRTTIDLLWSNDIEDFNNKLKNVLQARCMNLCRVCLNCSNYIEQMNKIKNIFLKKYPHLKISPKNNKNGFLQHIKPVKNLLNIDTAQYKNNPKLYSQILYVKLKNCNIENHPYGIKNEALKPSTSGTGIKKPFFRIKLKSKRLQNPKKVTGNIVKPKIKLERQLIVKLERCCFSKTLTKTEKSNDDIKNHLDSEEEESSPTKSYVDYIQQNNDNIFNNLKNEVPKRQSIENNNDCNHEINNKPKKMDIQENESEHLSSLILSSDEAQPLEDTLNEINISDSPNVNLKKTETNSEEIDEFITLGEFKKRKRFSETDETKSRYKVSENTHANQQLTENPDGLSEIQTNLTDMKNDISVLVKENGSEDSVKNGCNNLETLPNESVLTTTEGDNDGIIKL